MSLTDLLGSDAPAVAARVRADGVAHLNVGKGELAAEVTGGPLTGLKVYDPPPEWQKLADERCKTCGGEGWRYQHLADDCYRSPCADCHEGRPVHTISTEQTSADNWPTGDDGVYLTSRAVEEHVTVRLVPVAARLRPESQDDYILEMFGRVRHYYPGGNGRYRYITIPGLPPSPGDYVAVVKKVARQW